VHKTWRIGFVSLKQGSGEKMERRSPRDARFFAYYNKEEFEAILAKNGFEVSEFKLRPMSAKTIWLCFFVRIA